MAVDVAGLGNALIDALVVLEDDSLLDELGLVRGTMHPVDHSRWQEIYERIREHEVTFDSGGSCANAIATVGVLGGSAIYCGQVGDDQMGKLYAQKMNEACGQHALRFVAQPTGKCLSVISKKDAERTMLTDLGAATGLSELGTFLATVRQAKVAHFTGYTLLGGPMRQAALEAIHEAHANGVKVSLDVADPFVVMQLNDLLWNLIDKYCDLVFLNAEEAKALTDKPAEEAVTYIAENANVATVCVKLGGRGSLVWHDGQVHEIPVFSANAIDTTGAGDAYAGGYLYGYVNGWAPAQAGRLASAVAARTVSQIGAVYKDRAGLQALLADLRGAGA